jgi:hypothetical protein
MKARMAKRGSDPAVSSFGFRHSDFIRGFALSTFGFVVQSCHSKITLTLEPVSKPCNAKLAPSRAL